MDDYDAPSPGTQELMRSPQGQGFHSHLRDALETSAVNSAFAQHQVDNSHPNGSTSNNSMIEDRSLEEKRIRLSRILEQNLGDDMDVASFNYREPSPRPFAPRAMEKRPERPRQARRLSKPYFEDNYDDEFVVEEPRLSRYTPTAPQFDDSHRYANVGRLQKTYASTPRNAKPMFSHDDLISQESDADYRQLSQTPIPRQAPEARPAYFNNTGEELAPSRYSGAPMPWNLNKQPPAVPQDEVSNAALLKRGLKRGEGDKVIKRGYGANDPENIAIVNMKEQEDLSFEQITKILNEKRIRDGRDATLTVSGVNGRYNRTAPLLFSAQGKEFIPLRKRKLTNKIVDLNDNPVFDDDTDVILVQCVKDVDAQKWFQVAQLFTDRTGIPMNPKSAAVRHGML